MNRAERIHHKERIKAKRKSYIVAQGKEELPESQRQKHYAMIAKTPQMCSCLGCGNERQYEGETLQERRKDLNTELNINLIDSRCNLSELTVMD